MRTKLRGWHVLCAALAALASTAGAATATAHTVNRRSTGHPLTAAQIAALPPEAQARLLQPLRRLAGDLDREGRAHYAAVYAGVSLDAPADTVDLYVSEPAAGRDLISHARQADRHASWRKVHLRAAAFSAEELDAAAKAVIATKSHTLDIASISVPVTGTGLTVAVAERGDTTSSGPGTGQSKQAVLTAHHRSVLPASGTVDGVPVRYRSTPGDSEQKSWAADKWQDTPPFIGGDFLTSNGHNACTAGLPAINRSTGRPVMITAAHCFGVGTRVYTGAGTPGDYGNGLVGNYVGTVTARNQTWDGEELVGANNNADESDTYGWKPLTSVAYSYVGDYVCQNGAASFYLGHPTPCGIKVTNQDLWFPVGGYWARGVEGIDVLNGWGSHNGDSGGTVFAVEPGGVRQARGIISSGGADGTTAQKRVDWTEAVDIFRAFNLKLNPQT